MNQRKCANCGATLEGGGFHCGYCGSDWTPPPIGPGRSYTGQSPDYISTDRPLTEKKPGSPGKIILFLILLCACWPAAIIYMWTATDWPKKLKTVLTFLFFLPVLFIGVYGYFYETHYALRMQTAKYSDNPPAAQDRAIQDIHPEAIYKDLRDSDGKTMDERQRAWRENYQGLWVQWEGTVTAVLTYTSSASELKMESEIDAPYSIEVYFDPTRNKELEKIAVDDNAKVSGMLWGYYLLSDTIRLADGVLLGHSRKGKPPVDAQETPENNPDPL